MESLLRASNWKQIDKNLLKHYCDTKDKLYEVANRFFILPGKGANSMTIQYLKDLFDQKLDVLRIERDRLPNLSNTERSKYSIDHLYNTLVQILNINYPATKQGFERKHKPDYDFFYWAFRLLDPTDNLKLYKNYEAPETLAQENFDST